MEANGVGTATASPNGGASASLRKSRSHRPLDRQHVRLFRSHAESDDGGYMEGTPAERLSQVWELTREVWSWKGHDAEQRLQRHVAGSYPPRGLGSW